MHLARSIRKKAEGKYDERIRDWAGRAVSGYGTDLVLPGSSSVTGLIGSTTGLMGDDAKEDLKDRGSDAKSFIPGVGAHRQGQVMRAVADESGDRGRKQLLHELIGDVTGSIGGALAGAAVGAGVGNAIGDTNPWDDNTVLGAAVGGVDSCGPGVAGRVERRR